MSDWRRNLIESPEEIARILRETRRVAVLGMKTEAQRGQPAFYVPEYMARAGYDPRESIRFWKRMEETGGNQPPEFLSTHPSHGTRVQQLEEWMPQALEEYGHATQH